MEKFVIEHESVRTYIIEAVNRETAIDTLFDALTSDDGDSADQYHWHEETLEVRCVGVQQPDGTVREQDA